MINPNDVFERFRLAGIAWAEADGEAAKMEEKRKSFRAQLMIGFGETKVNRAEMLAESDPSYVEYLDKMVEARTKANIAKAEFDAIKAWIEITRTLESSRRAEMQLR